MQHTNAHTNEKLTMLTSASMSSSEKNM